MYYLQPENKTFGFYVRYGYLLTGNKPNESQEILFRKISIIDDSILILDDIKDKSLLRNGKPCLYKKIGMKLATLTAEKDKQRAEHYLKKLMNSTRTETAYQNKIMKKFSELINKINIGQKMDSQLSKINKYSPQLIKKYFIMIKTFTSNHVKYGIEIGQLLANRSINKRLSKEADSAGKIRQIMDDFNDYYAKHHEPFGDFKSGSNRLPEILFKKNKGNRNQVLALLAKKRYKEARNLVLTNSVRMTLYLYCKKECAKISPRMRTLVENYNKILLET
jgi:geranylgeranyl pyrophosphate synthase